MKAETPNSGQSTAPDTDEEQSLAGSDTTDESERQGHEESGSEDTQGSTVVGSRDASSASVSTQATIGKKSSKGKTKAEEELPKKKSTGDAENLIGRINNLVTSDLASIVEGCDLFSLGTCFF